MCITSGLCCAGNLFIQVILLLSSPGETPLTLFRQQVHTYYRLRLNQLLLRPSVLNPNVFSFDDSPLFYFAMSNLSTPIRSMLPPIVFATDNSVRQPYFWWRWADLHRRPQQLSNNFYECLLNTKRTANTTSAKPQAPV